MKKISLIFALLMILLAFSACGKDNDNATLPTLPNPTTTGAKVDACKNGHTFNDTDILCEKCGADYFATTLEFTLTPTRDSYIVTGLGTCTRTVIHVPATYKSKPVTEIASTAFNAVSNKACNNITEITLPTSIVKINSNAFYMCEKLTKLEIQEGVTFIGSDVLRGCPSLESIRIPNTLAEIPNGMVWDCTSLKNVEIGEGVWHIGSNAFSGCTSLESLVIPNAVKKIDVNAFFGCTTLHTLSIPSGIEDLGRNLFTNCNALEYNVYNGMGYLGNDSNPYLVLVNRMDPTLKAAVLHDDTKAIIYEAFVNTDLTSLSIGKNLTLIPYGGLGDLKTLESITVAENNPKYHVSGNCLIETEAKMLIKGTINSVIPSDGSVTSIGAFSFEEMAGLTSIVIPDSVLEVQGLAFYNCKDLTTLIIGKSLKVVQLNGFSGCTNLTAVYYEGSAAEWSKINIPVSAGGGAMSFGDNYDLLNAPRYYYSEEQPANDGNFWHYEDGKPTPWESGK